MRTHIAHFVLAALMGGGIIASGPQTLGAQDLNVTVLRAGQPIANATVCAGTDGHPSQHGHTRTNANGVASFSGLPVGIVMVTARSGQTGVNAVRERNRFGQYYTTMSLRLPISPGGPSCGVDAQTGIGSAGPRPGMQDPVTPTPVAPRDVTLPASDRELGARVPPISRKVEYCLGALGMQCGDGQSGLPASALCANGRCKINAGSWAHDECCFANPNGMACSAGPADAVLGHDGQCVSAWDRALSRLAMGFNWTRPINFREPNRNGRVVHSQYCAQPGSIVHREDARFCCSRQVRSVTVADAATAVAQGVNLAIGDARVCR